MASVRSPPASRRSSAWRGRLHRTRSLPDDLYAQALAELGRDQVIELVTLTGVYNAIAFLLLGFEVDLLDGAEPAF